MNNLLAAIATKILGSALSSDVAGRIYLDQYPPDEMPVTYPYIIYFIITDVPEDTFTDSLEDVLIQFSLFSASSGAAEITTMYADLKTLFDDKPLAIAENTHIWTIRQNLAPMVDEIITKEGTVSVKHWPVDYSIMMQKI